MILTIIVTYNGEEYIEDCLHSIQKQTCMTDVLVVDNGSADNTCSLVEKEYPQVRLLKLERNIGFAGANNVGIRYAMERGYEYVLLLNEDTVADQFLIQKLMKYVGKNVAVIPKIYMNGSRTKVWYAAGQLDFERGVAINCREDFMDKVMEVTFMTGCCMLIHVNVFAEVGLFDENYFMYYEDTDLSIRMYKHKIKMLYVPDTYVWHRLQGKGTKPYYAYYMTRNRLYFLQKHSKDFQVKICSVIGNEIKKNVLDHDISTKAFRRYRLKAIQHFIKGHMGYWPLDERNGKANKEYRRIEKYRIFHELTCEWIKGCAGGGKITDWIEKKGYRTVAIYGMGLLGETIYMDLCKCESIQVKYGFDMRDTVHLEGLRIYHVENCPGPVDLIIVSAVMDYAEIKNELKTKLNFQCRLISLTQLIEEMFI